LRILLNLNYLSEILPFFFCLFFLNKINSKEIKVFFVYKTFAVLLLFISLTTHIRYSNTILSIFVVQEFILLSIMYSYIIKSLIVKKILLVFILIFAIYCFYALSSINLQKSYFDFTPAIVESLFFIVVIIYYFYEIMRFNFATPLFQLTSFWISVAFVIFFSGTFFLLLYSKTMFNEPGFDVQYIVISCTLTIIKNILLCVALFVNKNLVPSKDNTAIPSNLNLDTFQPLNKQTNF
jgi:hypothetical protein